MSKAFYLNNPHLHKFPKFQSAIRHLQVGNGALVPTLFVIPLVFKINGHNFEVHTLVSEIQDKMDLILGVKNIFELEGIMNTRICSVSFLNRFIANLSFRTPQNKTRKNGLCESQNSFC